MAATLERQDQPNAVYLSNLLADEGGSYRRNFQAGLAHRLSCTCYEGRFFVFSPYAVRLKFYNLDFFQTNTVPFAKHLFEFVLFSETPLSACPFPRCGSGRIHKVCYRHNV
jgi:hypothetical protein